MYCREWDIELKHGIIYRKKAKGCSDAVQSHIGRCSILEKRSDGI